MSTFVHNDRNFCCLTGMKKGDVLEIYGDKYVILSNREYDEYYDMYMFMARSFNYEIEADELYGYYYIFELQDGTFGGIDGVCMYSDMLGPI